MAELAKFYMTRIIWFFTRIWPKGYIFLRLIQPREGLLCLIKPLGYDLVSMLKPEGYCLLSLPQYKGFGLLSFNRLIQPGGHDLLTVTQPAG